MNREHIITFYKGDWMLWPDGKVTQSKNYFGYTVGNVGDQLDFITVEKVPDVSKR